jgi:hypothetical protein
MTLQQFMRDVAYLPATAFSGLVNILFGYTKKNKKGQPIRDEEGNPEINRGILSLTLDAIKFITRFIADVIGNNRKEIAIGFWTSSLLGGAAALTVFLWPAALAAVATFSVFGISIASVVGTNALVQIGAIAALSFTTTTLLTWTITLIVNATNAIRQYVANSGKPKPYESPESSAEEELPEMDIGAGVSLYTDKLDLPPYQGSTSPMFTHSTSGGLLETPPNTPTHKHN